MSNADKSKDSSGQYWELVWQESSDWNLHGYEKWSLQELCHEIASLQSEVERLQGRCGKLEADAQRYRFLRDLHWSKNMFSVVQYPKDAVKVGALCPNGKQLDATIDEQRLRQKAGEN